MFSLLQRRRAQQEPVGAAAGGPVASSFAIFGMLPDPVDVGRQRIAEPIHAFRKLRFFVEKDEVEPRKRLRHLLAVHSSKDNRREAFVQRGGKGNFPGADRGGH